MWVQKRVTRAFFANQQLTPRLSNLFHDNDYQRNNQSVEKGRSTDQSRGTRVTTGSIFPSRTLFTRITGF